MKTAEALEEMTDAGEFEILATRVLRIVDEDCRLLEHMGVNAAGKTIANPIDSFCRVPDSDPLRFVMAAFTTEKPHSLQRKWLFDHSKATRAKMATAADDGDLIKAGHRAAALCQDHPDAKFIVHLCTNRRVDDELMAKVYKRGMELGLEVRFLAQSRLRDCLDTKREGQWLRKEHLGIQAELLSLSLFRELSRKSVKQFGGEFLVTPPERFISTTAQHALQQSTKSAVQSVHVVLGASGSGKSVASYQVLRDHVSSGYIGLWIPGENAAKAASLDEAVETTIRSLHPTIERGAGAIAISLATPSQRLFLVVDDVNRSGDPSATLRKLLVWGHPPTESDEAQESRNLHTILVPAWDVFWAPLDPLFGDETWLSKFPVGQMSEDDALRCLEKAMDTPVEALLDVDRHELVAALGHDPILIGMFAGLAKTATAQNALALAQDVMARFVHSATAEAAASGTYLEEEYDAALLDLARSMLASRELHPPWGNVVQWLSHPHVEVIRSLAKLGKICRVNARSGEQRFEFRHDRILEYYFTRVLRRMMDDPDKHADVLSDPYYASFVGGALAVDERASRILEWVRLHTPLALIAAIRFLKEDGDAGQAIIAAAKDWLFEAAQDPDTPPVVLYEAYRLLEAIYSPAVLDVTKSLRDHRSVARARLANGDAAAGAIEFAERRWFAPAVNDRELDAILDRAFHRHRRKLIDGCRSILESPDIEDDTRIGALTLAGFIGDSELSSPIQQSWNSAPNKRSILRQAFWAALRCGGRDPAALLDPVISVSASLSGDRTDGALFDGDGFGWELRFAMRRGIPDPVLHYLIRSAKGSHALRWPITFLLEHVNHPIVVRYLVEEAAAIEWQLKETDRFSPWITTLRDQWDPMAHGGQRLPPAALGTIRSCWESAEAEESLKKTAFHFWVRATDDLEALQSVPPTQKGYAQVLWRRARLGDLTVVPVIKPLLANDRNFFHVIHHIWSKEFCEEADRALWDLRDHTPPDHSGGYTDDHYMLAHLLRDIPAEDSEPLLIKHWEHLQYSRWFVQAALYLGTQKSLELAAKTIEEYPRGVDVFQYAGHFFGFFVHGLSDRVTCHQLDTLLPYLRRLDNHTLTDMARFCELHGYRDWAEQHLRPEFDRRRATLAKASKENSEYIEILSRRHFPSDADLVEALNRMEEQRQYHAHIWAWCGEFEQRQDDVSRRNRILEQWLVQSPTVERFKIVAQAILGHGHRTDLELLTKCSISGNQHKIAYIVQNARFAVMRRSLR